MSTDVLKDHTVCGQTEIRHKCGNGLSEHIHQEREYTNTFKS